jgi:uncharacterized caspase-like protein
VLLSFAADAQMQDLQVPQDQSVINAALRSRQQKKLITREPRVITNDDLEAPRAQKTETQIAGKVVAPQIVDETGTSANKDSEERFAESEEAAADNAEIARLQKQVAEAERKLGLQQRELALAQQIIAVDAEMASLQEQVAGAEMELNLQRRELALPQQVIYSNPRFLVNHAGQAELDSAQQRYIQSLLEIKDLEDRYAELKWLQWQLIQAATPDRRVPPP